MRITAYPPPVDPIIKDLCEHLNECARSKFYIKLETGNTSSGFYARSQTLKAAKAEAKLWLKKYPSWDKAEVWTLQWMLAVERKALIKGGTK